MPLVRVVAVVAVVLTSLAARAEEARCTLPNAKDWRAYRSKHFEVVTDVSRMRVEMLVARLERLHALVVKAMVGEDVEIPGHVLVVAFASPRDFHQIAGDDVHAYWKSASAGRPPTIVLQMDGLEADAVDIAHELAHHVSSFIFPRKPAWFAEGLAHFVETVGAGGVDRDAPTGSHITRGERQGDGGTVGLGRPGVIQWIENAPSVDPAELLTWSGREKDRTGRFHAWSWLLYHYLWNARSKALADFSGRLSTGDAPDTAWRAAFPDLDPARPEAMMGLTRELDRYRRAGRYVYYRVSAPSERAFQDAPISTADVHVLLTSVRSAWPAGDAAKALYDAALDEALREDPTHPVALVRRDVVKGPALIAALRRRAVERGDGIAWLMLGKALRDDPNGAEREAALRKAVAALPDNATANNALAWDLVLAHRAREALPFANRAVDLDPGNPSIVDTLATVAVELGKCNEGLALQRRAVESSAKDDEDGDELRRHLAAFEKRCAPASTSSAVTPAAATAPR